MEKELKQRMYGFVMYQLGATIHAGIQFGHAKDEFSIFHGNTKEYKRWLHKDKVYVILNGGTTNKKFGTMQANIKELKRMGIKHSTFKEEDMDNILTAVAFLVDERVFDKKKYPDLETIEKDFSGKRNYKKLIKQAKILEKIGIFEFRTWLFRFPLSK